MQLVQGDLKDCASLDAKIQIYGFDVARKRQALRAQMASAADAMQQSFAGLMPACANGDIIDMCKTLQKFPIQMTSVSDYAKRVLGKA